MSEKSFPSSGNLLKKKLHEESSTVAEDSMIVLEEFEVFEEEFSREELGDKDYEGKGDG